MRYSEQVPANVNAPPGCFLSLIPSLASAACIPSHAPTHGQHEHTSPRRQVRVSRLATRLGGGRRACRLPAQQSRVSFSFCFFRDALPDTPAPVQRELIPHSAGRDVAQPSAHNTAFVRRRRREKGGGTASQATRAAAARRRRGAHDTVEQRVRATGAYPKNLYGTLAADRHQWVTPSPNAGMKKPRKAPSRTRTSAAARMDGGSTAAIKPLSSAWHCMSEEGERCLPERLRLDISSCLLPRPSRRPVSPLARFSPMTADDDGMEDMVDQFHNFPYSDDSDTASDWSSRE